MLPNYHKAIELLRLLDSGAVDALLAQLPPSQAEHLRQRVAVREEGAATLRQRIQILSEFERGLQLATAVAPPPTLRLHRPDAARRQDPEPSFVPSGDPLEDLERMNVHQVARALEVESPRATAILLARLAPERSAELLSVLPDAQRDAVVREMSQDESAPLLVVEKMAHAVVARAALLPADPPNRADRVERLANVLRAVPKSQRRQMLDAIRAQDETTADAILEKLYTFDDLLRLTDRAVQQLLTEVDAGLLATALAGASEELTQKVLSNLSKRARAALQEELEFRAAPPAREVEGARQVIARIIARIDQEE